MTDLPGLLQLADTAFAAGAFAHSFGLETAIVEGRVHDEASLVAWVRTYLHGAFAPLDGAAFVLALRDGVDLRELDDLLGAAQPNAELRKANAHLARATLATFDAMGLTSPALAAYGGDVASGACDGQHALAAALGYDAAAIGWRVALGAHLTTTIATLASVAARAIPLGQRALAHARWTLRSATDAALERAAAVRCPGELSTGAPAIEIDGLRHRRLNGRLFAS